MAKHSEKKGKRKIIQLKDHMPQQQAEPSCPERETDPQEEELPQAAIEYGEGEDGEEKGKKPFQTPKAVYRVAVVLLVAVLALALWVNRDNLTPEKIWNWVQIQVMGDGTGDGYPLSITGSSVAERNFLCTDGNAVVLSDTALTITGPSGQELLSLRHSFNQPVLESASGKYLLFNQNSTGYLVADSSGTKLDGSATQDILAGGHCPQWPVRFGHPGGGGSLGDDRVPGHGGGTVYL